MHGYSVHGLVSRDLPEPLDSLLQSEGDTSVDEEDQYGCSPLVAAIKSRRCSRDMIRVLTKHGASLGPCKAVGGVTPLALAAGLGYTDCVRALIEEASGSPDACGAAGETSLHMACKNGATETVKYLLSVGAFVDTRDHSGLTPLGWACAMGRLDTARVMLTGDGWLTAQLHQPLRNLPQDVRSCIAGYLLPSVHAIDDTGTPLALMACQHKGGVGILTLLGRHGVDLAKLTDCNGQTALHVVSSFKCFKHLSLRHAYGNHHGLQACKRGNVELAKYLIHQWSADPYACDNKGWLPGHARDIDVPCYDLAGITELLLTARRSISIK
ncbi:unnamed protein product [Chrysoparadoxa australica]